ncbi:N-glycosidase Npun_R5314-like [Bemisia tabaci]|uniref:N-glycosidase Npun_R5314-like n=1 Tax=Bemisia tabaci TaxID=7038 RepID=UPI003B27EA62
MSKLPSRANQMSKLPTSREELRAAVTAGQSFEYFFFWGHRKPEDGRTGKSCLSQWYEQPFVVDGETFATAEHYMMARKARLFGDEEAARRALAAATPKEAKAVGRQVRGFSEEVWRRHRETIVLEGNLAKFGARPELRDFLLATGDAVIVEASPRDTIWGIGLGQDNPKAKSPATWRGLNLLGFALVKTRERLRSPQE